MSITINFVATRPNTNSAFWWESNDPTIISYRQIVSDHARTLDIRLTETISPDQLTYTVTYIANTPELWATFKSIIDSDSNLISYRKNYFTSNNHKLSVVLVHDETNEILRNIPVIS